MCSKGTYVCAVYLIETALRTMTFVIFSWISAMFSVLFRLVCFIYGRFTGPINVKEARTLLSQTQAYLVLGWVIVYS